MMETKNIMASSLTNSHASSKYGANPVKKGEIRLNEMGSEVVEGYTCKPKDYDPNRPIMHYKTLLLLCDDERCGKAGKIDKASHLREILKDMGLNKGANRIKISRTGCYGACRFRQVCQVTEKIHKPMEIQKTMLFGYAIPIILQMRIGEGFLLFYPMTKI